MRSENNDQQLIDKLKQLPKVKDHRDKDELFQQISTKMNERKPHKHNKFVPIFSTIAVVLLIIAIVPALINLDMPETSSNDSAKDTSEESSYDIEMSAEKRVDEQEVQMFDNQIESYVLQDTNHYSTIIYGAVSDDQIQTVIPLTIVIPKNVDLNTHYNQLHHYLDESEWGVNQYLFKDVNFDLNLAAHKVSMHIPDDFSLGDGSANAHIFTEVLTEMFIPYQIEKVVFDEEIDLGSIGNVSELDLQRTVKTNYKIFQAGEHQRKFLVPIKVEDDATIEDAFEEMKNGQESFNIYPTIPEDVELSLTSSGNELIVTSEHDLVVEDEQKATIMIEAILMSAKSFGYELVTFNNISIDQGGLYQLSKSIEVPEAINPIYQ